MKWEKIGNRSWRAVGAKGSFFIEQSGGSFGRASYPPTA